MFIGRLQINTTGCPSQHMVSDDNDLSRVIYIPANFDVSTKRTLCQLLISIAHGQIDL